MFQVTNGNHNATEDAPLGINTSDSFNPLYELANSAFSSSEPTNPLYDMSEPVQDEIQEEAPVSLKAEVKVAESSNPLYDLASFEENSESVPADQSNVSGDQNIDLFSMDQQTNGLVSVETTNETVVSEQSNENDLFSIDQSNNVDLLAPTNGTDDNVSADTSAGNLESFDLLGNSATVTSDDSGLITTDETPEAAEPSSDNVDLVSGHNSNVVDDLGEKNEQNISENVDEVVMQSEKECDAVNREQAQTEVDGASDAATTVKETPEENGPDAVTDQDTMMATEGTDEPVEESLEQVTSEQEVKEAEQQEQETSVPEPKAEEPETTDVEDTLAPLDPKAEEPEVTEVEPKQEPIEPEAEEDATEVKPTPELVEIQTEEPTPTRDTLTVETTPQILQQTEACQDDIPETEPVDVQEQVSSERVDAIKTSPEQAAEETKPEVEVVTENTETEKDQQPEVEVKDTDDQPKADEAPVESTNDTAVALEELSGAPDAETAAEVEESSPEVAETTDDDGTAEKPSEVKMPVCLHDELHLYICPVYHNSMSEIYIISLPYLSMP